MDGWVDDWMNEWVDFQVPWRSLEFIFEEKFVKNLSPSRRAQIFCNFIFEDDFQRPPWNLIGGWVDE